MPSFANISELASSHTADRYRNRSLVTITTLLACFVSLSVLGIIYSRAKVVTQSKSSRKPKAYFQFWAFNVFTTSFVIYTTIQNYDESTSFMTFSILIWVAICTVILSIGTARRVSSTEAETTLDIETPTHFCRCCNDCFHYIVFRMSLCSSQSLICFVLFSIPTIILVYYLYPARTLLRLPLLANAIFYINSLLALLLFQCELLCSLCENKVKLTRICCTFLQKRSNILCSIFKRASASTQLNERALTHHKYYGLLYDKRKTYTTVCQVVHNLIITMIILIIFILFVIISMTSLTSTSPLSRISTSTYC